MDGEELLSNPASVMDQVQSFINLPYIVDYSQILRCVCVVCVCGVCVCGVCGVCVCGVWCVCVQMHEKSCYT